MERPSHFQAEGKYFQDDRYNPSLWLGLENDTWGIILWIEKIVVVYLVVS